MRPSYSSPVWLHKDDEPLVFIHLFKISDNLLGGDNLISPDHEKISDLVRLKSPLETLVVNQKIFHAVTPMGNSTFGLAYRDILLVTFQNKIDLLEKASGANPDKDLSLSSPQPQAMEQENLPRVSNNSMWKKSAMPVLLDEKTELNDSRLIK